MLLYIQHVSLKEFYETIVSRALTAKCASQPGRLVAAPAGRTDLATLCAGLTGLWSGAGDAADQPVLDSGAHDALSRLSGRASPGLCAAVGHAFRALSRYHCAGDCRTRRAGERGARR